MAVKELDTQSLIDSPPPARFGRQTLLTIEGICMLGWLAFGLMHAARGFPIAAALDIGAALITAGLLWMTRVSSHKLNYALSHANLAVSAVFLLFAGLNSGQEDAMAIWFLCGIPLASSFLHGPKETGVWSAIAAVLLSIAHLSSSFVTITPEFVPEGFGVLFGQLILLSMLSSIAIASARSYRGYVEVLRDREVQLRTKAQELRITAKELVLARDEAMEALRVRGEFVANMSHEIRTPLNGVLGMTRVLLDTNLSPDQEQMVRTIDKSGKSLLGVINEILDFSKLEAGDLELESMPFDLRECIEDVLDLFSGPAFEKGLDLAYTLDYMAPVTILGDVTRLRQVLMNLISNAVKFTESGEVMVHVTMREDRKLHFQVEDTGIGISESDKNRLFESFTQADASTTRKYGGTGLGLAISKRLAEALGGEMWVTSIIGKGSTFHFTIDAEETDRILRTGELSDPMSLYGRKMLVFSRPRAARESLLHMVDRIGMEYVCANQPGDAKEALEELGSPDCIVVFDGEDHHSIQRTINDLFDDPPPVVFVAALADATATRTSERYNYEKLLFRPVRYRQLRQAVESAIEGWTQESPRSLSPFDPTLALRVPLEILVAEDNIVNQQVISAMLKRLGYEPEVVSTGKEAFEHFKDRKFDLVLMDMHMPEMDGIEAARRIRSKDTLHQPHIVAITADITEAHRRKCLQAGMNDFLGKPFEAENLVHVIEKIGHTAGLLNSDEMVSFPESSFDSSRLDQLKELFPKDSGKYDKLIQDHLVSAGELVTGIEQAVRDNDPELLKIKAHTLKSSSAMFGSIALSNLAKEFESLATSKDVPQAKTQLGELTDAWASARRRLQKELNS